jgi:hypothetical protein
MGRTRGWVAPFYTTTHLITRSHLLQQHHCDHSPHGSGVLSPIRTFLLVFWEGTKRELWSDQESVMRMRLFQPLLYLHNTIIRVEGRRATWWKGKADKGAPNKTVEFSFFHAGPKKTRHTSPPPPCPRVSDSPFGVSFLLLHLSVVQHGPRSRLLRMRRPQRPCKRLLLRRLLPPLVRLPLPRHESDELVWHMGIFYIQNHFFFCFFAMFSCVCAYNSAIRKNL